jgi:type I restriction enzyme S subunit
MASNWAEVPFNDLGEVGRGKSKHRPRYAEHLYGGKYPFIQTGDIRSSNGRITEHTQTYSEEGLAQSKLWPKGTMCITIAANIAETAILTYPACFPDSVVGFIANEDKCDVRFIEYSFRLLKRRLQSEAIGSVQDNINLATLSRLNIKLPPLIEQKAIAHILGSLDDKIELNRQMNETLEAMAQTLFKSWFVDFDPVIDNALAAGNAIPDEFLERAEQRKTIEKKDSSDTQGLFPDAFEFTEEMGWIPRGWQELQIKDIAKVVKGKSYKSSELSESETALVTLKSFKRGGGYRLDGLKEYTGKYKEEQEVKAGDLVIAYTDVTQAADLIGKPAMVIDDIRYKHLVISLDVAVVRPEIDSQKYYLYGLAQTEAFQSHNYSHSTGTTVLHLSKNAVPDYYLCLPSENLLHGFTKIVEPLFTSVNNNIGEIRNLEKLRDTLLPKLMSGELRIPDAATLMDEVL